MHKKLWEDDTSLSIELKKKDLWHASEEVYKNDEVMTGMVDVKISCDRFTGEKIT